MNDETKPAKWPQGIIFKKPREGVPDYVKGHLSFKVDEAVPWLKANENNGWVNLDIKKSKEGKLYIQLNEWKKETKKDDFGFADGEGPGKGKNGDYSGMH